MLGTPLGLRPVSPAAWHYCLDPGAELRIILHIGGALEAAEQKPLGVFADAGPNEALHDVADLAAVRGADLDVGHRLTLAVAGPGHMVQSDVGDGFVAQAESLQDQVDHLAEYLGLCGLIASDHDLRHDFASIRGGLLGYSGGGVDLFQVSAPLFGAVFQKLDVLCS